MVWSVSRVGGGPVVEGTVRLSLHLVHTRGQSRASITDMVPPKRPSQ